MAWWLDLQLLMQLEHIITNVVSSNPLDTTCGKSVVFSGSINKTDRYDIPEILMKVALNTILPKQKRTNIAYTILQ